MGTFPAMLPFATFPYLAATGGPTTAAPKETQIVQKKRTSAQVVHAVNGRAEASKAESKDVKRLGSAGRARLPKRIRIGGDGHEGMAVKSNSNASLALLASMADDEGALEDKAQRSSAHESNIEDLSEKIGSEEIEHEHRDGTDDVHYADLGIDAASLATLDDKELKKLRRKYSNRESARRSRMRKQAEIEQLQTENGALRAEVERLKSHIIGLEQQLCAFLEKAELSKETDSNSTEPIDNGPNRDGEANTN